MKNKYRTRKSYSIFHTKLNRFNFQISPSNRHEYFDLISCLHIGTRFFFFVPPPSLRISVITLSSLFSFLLLHLLPLDYHDVSFAASLPFFFIRVSRERERAEQNDLCLSGNRKQVELTISRLTKTSKC